MERKIKIRVVLAIIYGIVTIFLGVITAGCVDGVATVTATWNVAIAGILFAILSLIEIGKVIKLANGYEAK